MHSILEVEELRVAYHSRNGAACQAVAGVTFALSSGEILGVLGESGSGKSTLAASLLRLLPANGRITGGRIVLQGQDLLGADSKAMQRSEEHTSELQSPCNLVCRLLLEKKKIKK